MKHFVPLCLLLVTVTAHAAPVPVKAPAAGAPATPPAPQRFPGVSDAGNAILAKARATPDPQLQALARQQRAARDQMTTVVMAPAIDLDKVTAALRQDEEVQSQIRTHNLDRLLAVLKQLPPEDRGTFLRTLMLARASRGTTGAPAATSPVNPQP